MLDIGPLGVVIPVNQRKLERFWKWNEELLNVNY